MRTIAASTIPRLRMPLIVVGLGSNLGSREAFLRAGELMLRSRTDVVVRSRSRLYVSAAVGPAQPDYFNAALALETRLHPRALLPILWEIEASLGRVRRERWGPRTLDLDVLFWSGGVVKEPGLDVPHAELTCRPFALAPLLDLVPELESYRRRLEVLGSPAIRAWARTSEEAFDGPDARALALTEIHGPPPRVSEIEPLQEGVSPSGSALVVLEPSGRRLALRG